MHVNKTKFERNGSQEKLFTLVKQNMQAKEVYYP